MMRSRPTWASVVALLAMAGGGSLSGQELIQDCLEPCPSVRLDPVIQLGTADGPGIVESEGDWGRVMPNGEWALISESGDRIRVFSSDGTYLRDLGRRGEGPGEFQWVSHLLFAGDTLVAVDRRLNRLTWMREDGTVVRTEQLTIAPGRDTKLLPDGRILTASIDYSPNRVGFPLHLVGLDGNVVRSFGSLNRGAFSAAEQHLIERRVAPSETPGAIWAVWRPQYRIEEWSLEGVHIRTLVRDVEWFPPGRGVISLDRAPDAAVVGFQARDGLLWVLSAVSDANWQEALEVDPSKPHGGDVTDMNGIYDTVVEAIDPVTLRVVASARIDPFIYAFAGPGLVGHVTYAGPSPVPVYQAYALQIQENAP